MILTYFQFSNEVEFLTKFTHFPGCYSWKYPLHETGESGELQLNHVKEKHHHKAISQHSSFSLLWQYINFFGVYHKISISSSTCPFTFLSLSSSTSTFTSITHLDNHLHLNDHLCCHVHHFRQLMHFASTLSSTFSSISSSINTSSTIPSIIFKPSPLSLHHQSPETSIPVTRVSYRRGCWVDLIEEISQKRIVHRNGFLV